MYKLIILDKCISNFSFLIMNANIKMKIINLDSTCNGFITDKKIVKGKK